MNNLPSKSDYVTAMRNSGVCIKDSSLRNGSIFTKQSRIIMYAGGYSIVFPYKLKNGSKVAVRCWFADIGNAKRRTEVIAKYLKKIDSPYFVNFEYIQNGILINALSHPVVKMDWVDGITLKEYINLNIKNKAKLHSLADNFLTLAKDLHKNELAHGDLQHGNILITKDEKLVLVDYDSMYVPELKNMKDEIKGLPGYQHPKRSETKYLNPKLDYFSELVIYLSILVFAEHPEYWPRYKDTEDLLFSKSDFINPDKSDLLNSLRENRNETISNLTVKLIAELKKTSIDKLLPIEELLIDKVKKSKEDILNKIKGDRPHDIESKNIEVNKPDPNKIFEKFDKPPVKTTAPKLSIPDKNKILTKLNKSTKNKKVEKKSEVNTDSIINKF